MDQNNRSAEDRQGSGSIAMGEQRMHRGAHLGMSTHAAASAGVKVKCLAKG